MVRSPAEIQSTTPARLVLPHRCCALGLSVMLAAFVGSGCATRSPTHKPDSPGTVSNEHLVMPVLWTQSSAEARAICYQTFAAARHALDQALRELKPGGAPPAIAVDIDDTILSSAPYQASLIRDRKGFPEGWPDWSKRAEAKPLPGSVDFLRYTASRNVEVFYITNRDESESPSTLKNLSEAGFPNADSAHLLPRGRTSNKESRRRKVMQSHTIVLLLGDTLDDFAGVFHRAPARQRERNVDWMRDKWGTRFIVLPNPTYGGWEDALYDYDPQLNREQKDSIRKGALNAF